MTNNTYDSTNPFGCLSIMATISMNRPEKEVEEKFLIRYATILKWKKFRLDDSKHGFERFLVEILSRINFHELEKLQNRLGKITPADEACIASIIQMPMTDIDKYIGSSIRWKPQYIEMLKSIDKTLLEHMYTLIAKLIDFERYGRKAEGKESVFYGTEIKEVITLNEDQLKNIKALPTAKQLTKAKRLAIEKGKVIPPKTQLFAHRLAKWCAKVASLPNLSEK